MPIDKPTPSDPHAQEETDDGSYPERPGLIPGTLIGDPTPVDHGQSEAAAREEDRTTHNKPDEAVEKKAAAAVEKADADAEKAAEKADAKK